MSGESLIMDEKGSGGGGVSMSGGGSDVIGSGGGFVAATRTSLSSSSSKSSPTGQHHGAAASRQQQTNGQGNQKFPQYRQPYRSRINLPTESENFSGGRNAGVSATRTSPPTADRQPRRRIRKDKGKWKPYHTLTWEEKRERDALETQRAEEKRLRRSNLGYPGAPYNTTQFLMADHGFENGTADGAAELPSSDESNTAVEEDMEDTLARGYDQEWSRVMSEHLGSLSKNELIVQLLENEQDKSKLQERVRALEQEVRTLTSSKLESDAVQQEIG